MNIDNREYVVLDQLIAPGNPARYMNYVKDLKIIIVDRDPRDVYLHQLNHKDHVLPTDVYQFCKSIEMIERRLVIYQKSNAWKLHSSNLYIIMINIFPK